MSENIIDKSFEIVKAFGDELASKKSNLEYILFLGKFPESKLPYEKNTILGSSKIALMSLGDSQPEASEILKQTELFLYAYTSDMEARETFRHQIKKIANSDKEIDSLFELYIKKSTA